MNRRGMDRGVVALIAAAGVVGALIGISSHARAAETTHGTTVTDDHSAAAPFHPASSPRSVGELAARTDWYGMDDGQRGDVENGTRLGVPLDPARWA
jgi:hypothetical protein